MGTELRMDEMTSSFLLSIYSQYAMADSGGFKVSMEIPFLEHVCCIRLTSGWLGDREGGLEHC